MDVGELLPGLVVVVLGGALVYGGAAELAAFVRARGRRERARAVVVGHVDAAGGYGRGTATNLRSARLRFATRDGRVVETVGAAHSSFPREVGEEVTVTYDPADPEGTGDTVGTTRVRVALSPALVLGGVAFAAYGVILVARAW